MTIHDDSRSTSRRHAAVGGSVTALATFVASWVLVSWLNDWRPVLWLAAFACLLGLGLAARRSRRDVGVGVMIGALLGPGLAFATALAFVVFVIGDV